MFNDFSTKDSLKILQITDTHLFAHHSSLFGVNPNKNFDEVMKVIFRNELEDTDFILLTGDLSQDETSAAYQHLLKSFKNCKSRVFWLPGNHDNESVMSAVFNSFSLFTRTRLLELKHWNLVFIHSKLEGSGSGYIHLDELNEVEKIINASKKNIALIMHHHPIPVNTPLIDQYILNNREDLWKTISNSKVKLIVTGHVHGDYSFVYQGVNVECSPATVFQIKKGTDTLQIEHSIGYKIHYFDKDRYRSKAVIWEGTA
ncbi:MULTISPECIES: metallophosphoesterase [Legionella]|uniref:3',5'-cyclic adenosine monophosphate phosphodiesterase CpdA n=1 Tax=Legionella maceachernii TaxID=466 RepID=A0A0W0WBS8_9GAMM|nr:metallophosphoesterase [Legionella maceachernii]KTD29812.1 3',5'-cyclic adenosine monophosphate phosphodiesterase CpdA [Legionella maceachernii]SJZ78909.1 Icc protein [Legionella maceachernii]SUP02941.1 3',5'-cyclic adenosine monophosphate phosphodiesterase CpdA [Legionella maceachernii]